MSENAEIETTEQILAQAAADLAAEKGGEDEKGKQENEEGQDTKGLRTEKVGTGNEPSGAGGVGRKDEDEIAGDAGTGAGTDDKAAAKDKKGAEGAPDKDADKDDEPPKSDARSSRAWALISKKDRDIRQREKEIKAKEESLAKVMKVEEDLRTDPISFFAKHLDAKSLEVLQQRILEGGPNADERVESLTQQVKTLEEGRAADKQALEEKKETDAEQAEVEVKVAAYKTEISELVVGDDYAVGRAIAEGLGEDLAEEAAKYAGAMYEKTEELLSPAEALEAVDAFAKEQRTKFQELEAKLSSVEQKPEEKPISKPTAPAKTLKQADSALPPAKVEIEGIETEDDIIAEATAAMKRANAADAL